MHRSFLSGVILLGVIGFAGASRADWEIIRDRNGSPIRFVQSIMEDRSQSLWFGTSGGALRFDGVEWQTWTSGDTTLSIRQGLADANVTAILEDREGRLWFGGDREGISVLDGSRWFHRTVLIQEAPTTSSHIVTIVQAADGSVWVGTTAGAARYLGTGAIDDPASWRTYTSANSGLLGPDARHILEDKLHDIWIGNEIGLSHYDPEADMWIPLPAGVDADTVRSIGQDSDGRLWFGTATRAYRHDPDRADDWTKVGRGDGLPEAFYTGIAADDSGRVFLGGKLRDNSFDGGLLVTTNGDLWRTDTTGVDSGVLGAISVLIKDSSGNLLAAVGPQQVAYRNDRSGWRSHAINVPLTTGLCTIPETAETRARGQVMLQDREGVIWMATRSEGARRLGINGVWSSLRSAPGIPISNSLTALLEDRAGNLWFGSASEGVARLDASRSQWVVYTLQNGPASNDIKTLYQDRDGDIWIGTAAGLFRFQDGNTTPFLTGRTSFGVDEDAERNLWVRTTDGLFLIDAGRDAGRDSVLDCPEIPGTGAVVTDLAIDDAGNKWLATCRWGLIRVADACSTILREDGGPGDDIPRTCLLADGQTLWAGSDFYLHRINRNGADLHVTQYGSSELGEFRIRRVYQDRSGTVWVLTANRVSRFNGVEWQEGFQGDGFLATRAHQIFEDRLGHLWFPGRDMPVVSEFLPDLVSPQTVFERKPEAFAQTRNLTFVFRTMFPEESTVSYFYSFDNGPWCRTVQTTWDTTNVEDGSHNFRVAAVDWFGNVDASPAESDFVIDLRAPSPFVSYPAANQVVQDTVVVRGSAVDDRFISYRVEVQPADAIGDSLIDTLTVADTLVTGDSLASWDTTLFPEGEYDLRLVVTDSLGLIGTSSVRVIVDNHSPFARVTSPARVSAEDGGDVYTTDGRVHLYFPPNAFEDDDSVKIGKADVNLPEDFNPPGSVVAGSGYRIRWSQPLGKEKSAVLELKVNESVAAEETIALYVLIGDSLERIGGTRVAGDTLRAPIRKPGVYAVFVESGGISSGRALDALHLTPRVLYPNSRKVAISFTLGRPGTAMVRIFNRAGRLIRTVSTEGSMNSGSNLVYWDGCDDNGEIVTDDLYVVSVESMGSRLTETLAVVH